MTREFLLATGLLCCALIVAACGGGGGNGGGNDNNPPPVVPPPDPKGGLDARPQNTTCVAPSRTPGGAAITVENAFPGLASFSQPTKVLVEPVADPRWFVLQKTGRLRVFDPDNAVGSAPDFLTLSVNSSSEGGLLGMAFHPDYPATREIFLSYTITGVPGQDLRSIISRVILDDVGTPGPIGMGSVEQVILEVDQFAANHNGGDIGFGPDGYLYIGLGDGGGGGDPEETGQDTTRLLGSFLRIDVIGTGAGYDIPTGPDGNPFQDNPKCGPRLNAADCPEIFAWGIRNPWRWSFDAPTGVLWAGDVGQGSREEVSQIELGLNYGWDCREGTQAYESTGCTGPFEEPVIDYGRSNGDRSITGGFVYRGSAIPALAGRYVFGDFASGRVWALESNGGGFDMEELVSTGDSVSSFGIDQDGELYYTDYGAGNIMQLVSSGGGTDPVPDNLSDSGCVAPGDTTEPSAGLIPYELNAPFWSDSAQKQRFIGIPDATAIAINGSDDFVFPRGTVLVKNFRLNNRLVETRHLMRHPDGEWAGYTYEWNAEETEATRVRGGKTVNIEGQDWIFPDEAQCLQCHTAVAGVSLGAEVAQLNRDFTYPSTGRTANQLETLDEVAMFTAPLPGPADSLPALADPADSSASLDDRARAYLHTNCAQCHQEGGPTPVSLDLEYTTALADTAACEEPPEAGNLGRADPRLIDPGNPDNSVLLLRMDRRDSLGMPPIASAEVDSDGVTLIRSWINELANCN